MKNLKLFVIPVVLIAAVLVTKLSQTSEACIDSTKVYRKVETRINHEKLSTLATTSANAFVKVSFKINEKGRIQFTAVSTNNAALGIEVIKKLRTISFAPEKAFADKTYKIQFLF